VQLAWHMRVQRSDFLESLQDNVACRQTSTFPVVSNLYSTKTSKVFHVRHEPSGTDIALKCYCKDRMIDLQKIQAARETWFHSRLYHPNIISLYAAWIEKDKICLALEYAPIGSAFRKLRKAGSFPENVSAKYIIFSILCALQFLHKLGLIHRDIKPENILLTSDGCKLADLGLVINHKEEAANTCLGTFDYMVGSVFSRAHCTLLSAGCTPLAQQRSSSAGCTPPAQQRSS
jgi:serine/threonine protein kinase